MCTPSDTYFLGPTRVHASNGIPIGSAVFAQLASDGPYTLQRATPFPLEIALAQGGSGPRLIMLLLAHPAQFPKRHLDRFSRFCTAHGREFPYTLQWAAPFPLKIVSSHEVSEPPCNLWFLGPPSPQPKRHLDRFSRLCRVTIATDRPTDRPRYSVCNNSPHVYEVLRCGLILSGRIAVLRTLRHIVTN